MNYRSSKITSQWVSNFPLILRSAPSSKPQLLHMWAALIICELLFLFPCISLQRWPSSHINKNMPSSCLKPFESFPIGQEVNSRLSVVAYEVCDICAVSLTSLPLAVFHSSLHSRHVQAFCSQCPSKSPLFPISGPFPFAFATPSKFTSTSHT